MADVKISELTALTSPSGGEELVVNASGTTKKITITNATSAKAPLASPVFTGNVGIGVTPQANWHSNYDAVAIGEQAVLYAHADGIGNDSATYLGTNVYENSGSKYLRTDKSSLYRQQSGKHDFYVAPSGTADSAISWTTAMTIDNSGNVGIGVTPEAHHNSHSALQVGGNGVWTSLKAQGASGEMDFQHNAYYSQAHGGDRYISTDEATKYRQVSGAHQWYTAGSGSADAAISWRYGMQINNDGIVTKPLQPYFAAYINTGSSWGSINADIALPFNNTDVNIGGHFNTSNYRFTAPVVGVYAFSAGFITNQTAGLGRMVFYINGASTYSNIQYGMNGSDHTGSGSSMATAFIKLAANDYVDFRSQSGTIVAYQSKHSSFTGYLLG